MLSNQNLRASFWLRMVGYFVLTIITTSSLIGKNDIPNTFENPILSGYHPDPSICRVGDDYYLVNSTFIWFPGIPVYHSKDLVNWKLIGHGIDRSSQLNFDGLKDREGLYAVTIRYHDGTFYLITTQVGGHGGNFYLTAKDPAGPWSDPIWLREAPGIDPSLMWDNGKCYYTGHMWIPEQQWPTQCGIWMQELDLKQQKLVGDRKVFTYGHANNASYSEGPHLYKINGNYMLLHSEGGTGLYHALSVHHSDQLWGPYIADMINPVITHRHLGADYPVQAIGHGDLVETQNGEWWCVTLGKRVIDRHIPLARETFLARVEFDGKTPVFNRGAGRMLVEQTRPDLPWTPVQKEAERDEFDEDHLALKWCTIRIPNEDYYSVSDGQVQLRLKPESASGDMHSSMLVQRIEHHQFTASTKLEFTTSKKNEQSGLIIYRTSENYYLLVKEKETVVLIKSFKGEKEEIARVPYAKKDVCFKANGDGLDIDFFYGESPDRMTRIGSKQSLIVICDGNGNQFNGAGIGMYASSNHSTSENCSCFDWFEYRGN